MSGSAIADLEVIPIVTPAVNAEDCDGSADTVIVRITRRAGPHGIGEADAPPGWSRRSSSSRACISGAGTRASSDRRRPVRDRPPCTTGSMRHLLPGRRGLGIHALSAIDMALHDLAGKQLGRPVYKLMGGARRESLSPYCDHLPGPARRAAACRELMREIGRQFDIALDAGFRAVKIEVLFYDLVTDRELVRPDPRGPRDRRRRRSR